MLNVVNKQNTVFNKFIAELRDVDRQRDSMRFRRNLERVGEVMAYEISKKLGYTTKMVETPLGEAEVALPDDEIVIATVLRAGIPFQQGFLNYFDDVNCAFIAAYRKYGKNGTFKIKVEYISSCDLTDKVLILLEPMIATGESIMMTYEALLEHAGMPRHTHIATVIASEQGVEYVRKRVSPAKVSLWCGAVDEELTVKSYIIPGIGDAGDLAYGEKI